MSVTIGNQLVGGVQLGGEEAPAHENEADDAPPSAADIEHGEHKAPAVDLLPKQDGVKKEAPTPEVAQTMSKASPTLMYFTLVLIVAFLTFTTVTTLPALIYERAWVPTVPAAHTPCSGCTSVLESARSNLHSLLSTNASNASATEDVVLWFETAYRRAPTLHFCESKYGGLFRGRVCA